MAEFDDIPDLEDFSEELSRKKEYNTSNQKNKEISEDYAKERQAPSLHNISPPTINAPPIKQEEKKEISNIPIITSKPAENTNNLQFNEVQEAMKTNLVNDKSWMTPELLKKITEDPVLMKGMMDKDFMEAFNIMQTNPKLAIEKYKNKPGFQEFLQKFMGLMGNHFEKLGVKTQQQEPTNKKPIIQDISKQTHPTITDPEVLSILQDKQVQNIIEHMQKTQKPFDLSAVARTNPQLAQKLFILIQKGFFNMERR